MTDSFFDTVLWPTAIGGLVIFIILILVYWGMSLVDFIMAKTIENDINWKNIGGYFVIVCVVLAFSWLIGSRILMIYYGG